MGGSRHDPRLALKGNVDGLLVHRRAAGAARLGGADHRRQGDDRTRRRDRTPHRRPRRSRLVGGVGHIAAARCRHPRRIRRVGIHRAGTDPRTRTTGPFRGARSTAADARSRCVAHCRVRHADAARAMAARRGPGRSDAHRRVCGTRRQQRAAVVGPRDACRARLVAVGGQDRGARGARRRRHTRAGRDRRRAHDLHRRSEGARRRAHALRDDRATCSARWRCRRCSSATTTCSAR